MTQNPLRIVQVGIGGFGRYIVQALLDPQADEHGLHLYPEIADGFAASLVAAVDPAPRGADDIVATFAKRDIPIFADLEQALDTVEPDLVVLCTPIHLHAPQSLTCMRRGIPVLCEKPAAAVVADAEAMAAGVQGDAWCGIGFQWSYSKPIQALKADLQAGRWGKPRTLTSVVNWPRAHSYYQRNGWAGRLHGADGTPVFDSPVANATAHFLHNALYCLGTTRTASHMPHSMQLETYRVNAIESYDSAVIRLDCGDNVQVVHACSHAVDQEAGPILRYECDDVVISYARIHPDLDPTLQVRRAGELIHDYGNPEREPFSKLWQAIAACQGGPAIACPITAALPQLRVANATHDVDVHHIPAEFQRQGEWKNDPLEFVSNMASTILTCGLTSCLPSELAIPWAQANTMSIPLR